MFEAIQNTCSCVLSSIQNARAEMQSHFKYDKTLRNSAEESIYRAFK
jgi:hypothetical protein